MAHFILFSFQSKLLENLRSTQEHEKRKATYAQNRYALSHSSIHHIILEMVKNELYKEERERE